MHLTTKVTEGKEEKAELNGKVDPPTEKRTNRLKKKGKIDYVTRAETEERLRKAKTDEQKKPKARREKKVVEPDKKKQDVSSSLVPAYQVSFGVTNCGKRVASTKRRIQWRYVCTNMAAAAAGGGATTDEEHNVILMWSTTSGKRRITMNEEVICTSVSRSSVFEYCWTWGGSHTIKMIAHLTAIPGFRQYDLIMDGRSFFSLPKFLEIASDITVASSVSLASSSKKKVKKDKKKKKQKKLAENDQPKKAARETTSIKAEKNEEEEEEDDEESTRPGMQYLTQRYFGDKKKSSNHRNLNNEHERGGPFQTMTKKRKKLKDSLNVNKWLDDGSQEESETERSVTETEESITATEEEEESDFESLIESLDGGCGEDGNPLSIDDSFWLDEDQEWDELENMEIIDQFVGPEEMYEEPGKRVVRRQTFHNVIQQLEEENADFKGLDSDSEDEGMPVGIEDNEDVIMHVQALVRGYLVRQRLHKEMSSSVKDDTSNYAEKSNNSKLVADVGNYVVGFWLWIADGADRYVDPDRFARKEKASALIQAACRGYLVRRQDNMEAILLAYVQRFEC